MNLEEKHFNQWLFLFNESIDEHANGEVADDMKKRASVMATLFLSKINYYKGTNSKPLI